MGVAIPGAANSASACRYGAVYRPAIAQIFLADVRPRVAARRRAGNRAGLKSVDKTPGRFAVQELRRKAA